MPEDKLNSTDSPEEVLDDSTSEQPVINPILAKNSVLFPEKKTKTGPGWLAKLITGFAASVLLFLTLCTAFLGAMYAINPEAFHELLGSAVTEFIAPDSPQDSQSQSPNN